MTTHPGIAFLSWLTFFALLLYGLGLLAGLVALFETQSTRPHVSVWVAFRPLTLHISAWRGAAGCCVSGRETSIETIGRNISLKRIERNFFKGDIRISLITPVYVRVLYRVFYKFVNQNVRTNKFSTNKVIQFFSTFSFKQYFSKYKILIIVDQKLRCIGNNIREHFSFMYFLFHTKIFHTKISNRFRLNYYKSIWF